MDVEITGLEFLGCLIRNVLSIIQQLVMFFFYGIVWFDAGLLRCFLSRYL